jgi:hypothetical protein
VRRSTTLRVVHGWYPPPYFVHTLAGDAELHSSAARSASAALTEVLRPWRQKYPDIELTEDALFGSAVQLMVDASRRASLVVVGRRARHRLLGTHIGPVAQGSCTTPPHPLPWSRTTDCAPCTTCSAASAHRTTPRPLAGRCGGPGRCRREEPSASRGSRLRGARFLPLLRVLLGRSFPSPSAHHIACRATRAIGP